jgi:signal transduction histidine kinase
LSRVEEQLSKRRAGDEASDFDPRILIVDDEPANLTLLTTTLRRVGYEHLETAPSGEAALESARREPPDLVLLDLHMPGMDGFEVMAELRARSLQREYLPIVVLTADASDEARRRALQEGATDFLTKPLDLLEILLRVGNLLETRRLHLELRQRNARLEGELSQQWSERMQDRQAFIARLVHAQEDERERIADEIHSDTIQTLIAIAVQAELVRDQVPSGLQPSIARLITTCRESIEGLRNLIFELHSPMLDDVGLAAAIREQLTVSFGEDWTLTAPDDLDIPSPIGLQLYRIAQAAIANTRQHAGCDHIDLSLRDDAGGIVLTVRDGGSGFDPGGAEAASGGLGIAVMRERAALLDGTVSVQSSPGGGTTVVCYVPVPSPNNPGEASS